MRTKKKSLLWIAGFLVLSVLIAAAAVCKNKKSNYLGPSDWAPGQAPK